MDVDCRWAHIHRPFGRLPATPISPICGISQSWTPVSPKHILPSTRPTAPANFSFTILGDAAYHPRFRPAPEPLPCGSGSSCTAQRLSLSRVRIKPAAQRSDIGWLWDTNLTWRSALLFFIGSIFFSFSSIAGLFLCIANHGYRNRLMVAYPYAFGSTLYTWGAYCSVLASLQFLSRSSSSAAISAGKAMSSDQESLKTAMQPRVSMSPVNDQHSATSIKAQSLQPRPGWRSLVPVHLHEWTAGFTPDMAWAHVDLIANTGVWVGTLLYNSSCITPAILCSLRAPLPPATSALVWRWAVAVPNVIAGCLFVSGSFACWAAAERTWSLFSLLSRPRSATYWSFLLYFLGSVGFLTGSLLTGAIYVIAKTVLVDYWFGLFCGYVLGSFCFLSGSFITVAQG